MMIKWLVTFLEREDERFVSKIRDSATSEKYLDYLAGTRITIFFGMLLIILIALFFTFFITGNGFEGVVGPIGFCFVMYVGIDTQIKMIKMMNYVKSQLKALQETRASSEGSK